MGNPQVEPRELREPLTGNADGNPEPSLRRESFEGAETYSAWHLNQK